MPKMENVLLKKDNQWVMTRVDAYKRYIHTIKPIEDLLNWLEE